MVIKMKTARELELSLLVKEAHIQQLKLKVNKLEEKISKVIALLTLYKVEYIPATQVLKILKGEDNE